MRNLYGILIIFFTARMMMGYTFTEGDKQYFFPEEKKRVFRWSEPRASEKAVIKHRIDIIESELQLMQDRLKEQQRQYFSSADLYIVERAKALIPELQKTIEYLQVRKQHYIDLYKS